MISGHHRRLGSRRSFRCALVAVIAFAGVLSGEVATLPAGAATQAAAKPVAAQKLLDPFNHPLNYHLVGSTARRNIAPPGQCTWGAFEMFHRATGMWPRITGDAWLWHFTAPANGWSVVPYPRPRSIVVFQPKVQGASSRYGHVGWVESVQKRFDGRWVTFVEMNGTAGPGRWDRRTVRDVSGMSYILAP